MASDQPLADGTAIVTGASSGIGAATARELARDGASVALAARSEDRLAALAEGIEADHGVGTLVVPTDVREETEVEALIERVVGEWGRLDVLVNNAGLARGTDVEELTTEQYRAMQATNVDGVFFATRAALPHLRDSSGNLIVIGSFAGQYPRSYNPVYAATKWWVRGFAHSVAASEAQRASGRSSGQRRDATDENGVAVTVINPSEVRTEFEAGGETFAERFPEGAVTEPGEVAAAVAFAARQKHSTVSELDLYRRDKFEAF
jgi:NADP-dependent 3-hydroxy acid dehydrogenase YdfG